MTAVAPEDLSAPARSNATTWLDAVERVLAAGLYTFLCWRFLQAYQVNHDPLRLLLLLSEGLILVFILIRRWSGAMSMDWRDWLLAFAGTCFPLLVTSEATTRPLVPEQVGALVFLAGVCIQLSAKAFLFRSFGVLPANRGVKRGGPYRLVRHPMYAGYFVSYVGFLLICPSIWNASIYLVTAIFQLARISREERLLSQDPEYRDFKLSTRRRLVPGLY